MSDTANPTPDWYPDPTGRFEQRYWDGTQWTEHVSSAGQQRTDPLPGTPDGAVTPAADLPGLGDTGPAPSPAVEPEPEPVAEAVPTIEPTPDTTPPPGWGGLTGPAPVPAESGPAPASAPDPEPVAPVVASVTPEPTAAVPTAATAPAPEWYPDPTGRHELRYWDGQDWTEHVTGASGQGVDPLPDAEDGGTGAGSTVDASAAVADPDPEANPFASAAVPTVDDAPSESTSPPPVPDLVAADDDGPDDVPDDDDGAGGDDPPPDDGPPGDGGGPGPAPDPAPQPAPAAAGPAPDWYPDPTGRQELRYWDGGQWTDHASTAGRQVVDPVGQITQAANIPVGTQDAARVQKQVQQQAGAVSTVAGGGSLFTEPILVVNQKWKLIEVNNEYAVYDQNGNQIGAVRQVGQSAAKKVVRVLTSFDQFMTHTLQVVDMAGNVQLTMTRPAKLVKSKVEVGDGTGQSVGAVVQQNAFGKIRFGLEAGGHTHGTINAENWRAWNFNIQDHTGTEVARITKTWEGLAKTMFTTADNYVLQIHRPLEEPLRSLVVASALCVDTALKQDSRGLG